MQRSEEQYKRWEEEQEAPGRPDLWPLRDRGGLLPLCVSNKALNYPHRQESDPHSNRFSFSTKQVVARQQSPLLCYFASFSCTPVYPTRHRCSRCCGTAAFFSGSPTLGSHSEQAPGFSTSGEQLDEDWGLQKQTKVPDELLWLDVRASLQKYHPPFFFNHILTAA